MSFFADVKDCASYTLLEMNYNGGIGYARTEESGGQATKVIKIPRWAYKPVAYITTFYSMIDAYLMALICKWRGHKLVDNGSYATPDSGAEHFACTRCHYSFHHTYY